MRENQSFNFNFKKIKKFNFLLDRHLNFHFHPPLEGRIHMNMVAIFNKYWVGKIDINSFAKLWARLIGPIKGIKKFEFDRYLDSKDVDFIEYLISSYNEPTIH